MTEPQIREQLIRPRHIGGLGDFGGVDRGCEIPVLVSRTTTPTQRLELWFRPGSKLVHRMYQEAANQKAELELVHVPVDEQGNETGAGGETVRTLAKGGRLSQMLKGASVADAIKDAFGPDVLALISRHKTVYLNPEEPCHDCD